MRNVIIRRHPNIAIGFLLITAAGIAGCTGTKELSNSFTLKYTPTTHGLLSKLNGPGYFVTIEETSTLQSQGPKGHKKLIPATTTFYGNTIFFDDGIILTNAFPGRKRRDIRDDLVRDDDTVRLPRFLEDMTEDTTGNMYLGGYWGTFQIVSDTIKVQVLHIADPFNLNDGSYGWEQYYIINDDNALVPIAGRTLGPLTHWEKKNNELTYYSKNQQRAAAKFFIAADKLPKADCPLKNNKWFWKNEEDYYRYIEEKRLHN